MAAALVSLLSSGLFREMADTRFCWLAPSAALSGALCTGGSRGTVHPQCSEVRRAGSPSTPVHLDNNGGLAILASLHPDGESTMGHLHIPLGGQIPIKEILSDMPPAPRALIKKGFSVVAKLPESAHSTLLKSVLASAEQRRPSGDEHLAKDLNIPVSEATAAMAALAMLSAIAFTSKATSQDVLQATIESGLISDAEKPALLRILPKLAEITPTIGKAVTRERLLNAVLPSFDDFDAELDIRIGGKEHAGLAVPVAVAFLDTDSRDQRLWFQLSKDDVEGLIEKLNLLLKRFKEAEELIAKFPSASGGA